MDSENRFREIFVISIVVAVELVWSCPSGATLQKLCMIAALFDFLRQCCVWIGRHDEDVLMRGGDVLLSGSG